jgi:hypothetical protein
MSDPVSWLVIEPDWKVVDSNGTELGRVEEVLGDSNADIFDGLLISSGLFSRPRYVPSEYVGEIVEGTVHLNIDRGTVEQLAESKESPAGASAGPGTRSEQPGFVRRALQRLGRPDRR